METEVFVDTSGFYACLVSADDRHPQAAAAFRSARGRGRFVTTDYVLDESITFLRARGHGHLVNRFFEITLSSRVCRVEWMDAGRFDAAQECLRKNADHSYSFTDCFSFCVMQQEEIRQALTKDEHFREAGFEPLLV